MIINLSRDDDDVVWVCRGAVVCVCVCVRLRVLVTVYCRTVVLYIYL